MATTIHKKSLGFDNVEPAVTPPPQTAEASFVKKPKIATKSRKRDIPEGLWTKCPACNAVLYSTDLEKNLGVCPKCGEHQRIGARAFGEPGGFFCGQSASLGGAR